MGRRVGALNHPLTVDQRAPRAVDDHIEIATLELIERLIIAAVALDGFDAGRKGLTPAGEQRQ